MNTDYNNDIDTSPPSYQADVSGDDTPSRQRSRKQRTMSQKGGEEMVYYGRSAYMLNRCLDDIESFGRQLKRHLKHVSGKLEEPLADSRAETPPSQDEAIDAVKKIKFAFNTVDEVKNHVPEAAFKVFIRLVKYIRWLDDLCRRQVIADYDSNLVSDVIEPLLSESTIMSLDEQLPPGLFDFWQELGPAWNTPAEKWPNSLTIYMPQFAETLDKHQTLQRWRKMYRSDTKSRTGRQDDDRSWYTEDTLYEEPKYFNPRVLDHDQKEHFLNVQEQGSRLCYTTTIHASRSPVELHAMQGEVFELIDSEDDSWWTVKTFTGVIGKLPKAKLRTFHLTKDQAFLDQDEGTDDLHPKTPSTIRYSRTGTFQTKYSRHRDQANGFYPRPNGLPSTASGRSHSLRYGGGTLETFEEYGVSRSPVSYPYHNHLYHYSQLPERCPSYLTLTDKDDTFRRPATLSRMSKFNSLYPIGSGTLRPFDRSPSAQCVHAPALGNLECGHPHPPTCSCEANLPGTVDTLWRCSIAPYTMGGTISRSNIHQSNYPVTLRSHGHQMRSFSMDSVEKARSLASSLQRFNSHTSVNYAPTMTLERKKYQHHKI